MIKGSELYENIINVTSLGINFFSRITKTLNNEHPFQ